MPLIMYSACQTRPRWMLERACNPYSQPMPISSPAVGTGANGRSVAVPKISRNVGAMAPNSDAS